MSASTVATSAKALNECCNCGHRWEDFPGAYARVLTMVGHDMEGREKWDAVCPKCKSVYFRWVNYAD